MSNTQATVARRGNINPIPSNTPIFDELDAHFLTVPTDTWERNTVVTAQVVAVRDTPIGDTDTEKPGALPAGAMAALWILVLGAAIGTIVWLYITLATGVFS